MLVRIEVSGEKWVFQTSNTQALLKQLDKIRDRLYYRKNLTGASVTISWINDFKRMIKYYSKKFKNITWINEVHINPNAVYIWFDKEIREADIDAIQYAFKGNEILIEPEYWRQTSALRVKVW